MSAPETTVLTNVSETIAQREGVLIERCRDYGIGDHVAESLIAYILHGRRVGHFLTALLSNDLMGAVGRADERNQSKLPAYCKILFNYAPGGCYGSPEHVRNWCETGGLKGLLANGDSR